MELELRYLVSSAHYGWVSSVRRKDGKITDIRWTKYSGGAMLIREKDIEDVRRWLYDKGIAHDWRLWP